jgi:hypothetical protein
VEALGFSHGNKTMIIDLALAPEAANGHLESRPSKRKRDVASYGSTENQ